MNRFWPEPRGVWLATLLAGWLASALLAEPVSLRPAQTLLANGAALAPGIQAIPCVTDWNGDGLPDLLVGYRNDDKIAVYLNSGTPTQPAFTGFTNLQAGGVDLQHPSAGCGAPAPWVVDYDGDSRRDLLVGTGVGGYVYLYQNTNSDAAPCLASGVLLMGTNGAPLTVSARATPYTHDWDGDGLVDLLCGAIDGRVYWFRNVGTAAAPAYAAAEVITAGGVPLAWGVRSAVRVLDWDGDGRKDLVGSGSYFAGWCRNVATNGSPVLEAPRLLQAPVSGSGLTSISTNYRMRLEVVDWNGDGLPDVLIGNGDGTILFYQGYCFRLAPPARLAADEGILEWTSALYLRYHVLGGPSPEVLRTIVGSNVLSAGEVTRWTNRWAGERQFFRIQVAP